MNDYPVELRGAKAPTLMWAHEYEVESQALQQIRNVASLPWVHGVRIMPDVHYGSGATIGSVIAMESAISPSAVGVDIGCVDKDSEYLSPVGWRKISEYDGGQVMQYSPGSGEGTFVFPSAFVVRPEKEFLYFKTKYGVDQMLSGDHKVLAYRVTGRDRRRVPVVISATALAGIHGERVQGAKYEFETSFSPNLTTRVDLTDDQIRLQVAFLADGTIPDRSGKGVELCVASFKKERKVVRFEALLSATFIPYKKTVSGEGVTSFTFHPPLRTKSYEPFWKADLGQLKVIADECVKWDGSETENVFYSGVKGSADFINYVFSATGYRSVLRVDSPRSSLRGSSILPEYRVFRYASSKTGLGGSPKSPVVVVPSVDGKSYCFTVPSGYWVMRRNGNIVMTGNCGVNAVCTSLFEKDLFNLHGLRGKLEDSIPVGFKGHDSSLNLRALGLDRGWDQFWGRFKDLNEGVQSLEGRAHSQMGSLGGGNHFIELCLDDDRRVWITLHSGSRNIGKSLAERHIEIAKKLPQNQDLPDRELAVFLRDTPEMVAYRRDLEWAQEFAMRSRTIMMELAKQAVSKHFHKAKVTFDDQINCFAGETKVITAKGVFPISELAGGTHTLLSSNGNWVEAPVKKFGEQKLYEVTVGRYGVKKVIRATAGHRWLLRPKTTHNRTEDITTGLRVGDRLAYSFPKAAGDFGLSEEGIKRGFIFGDGSAPGKYSVAIFCGDKDVALMPYYKDSKFLPHYYGPEKTGSVGIWKINGYPVEWKKEYPSLDSSLSELYGWLAGYFAADGDVDKTGRPTLSSSIRENLEVVKEICDKLGIGTFPVRARINGVGSFKPGKESYLMGFMRANVPENFFLIPSHRERFSANKSAYERKGWTVRDIRETKTVEEVYCAVVDGTHAFTLEDNILVGNCHHNYVAEEIIDGRSMLVTRKGAIRAGKGDLALIPGSMGTGSYIVRGLGNDASFQSASHGAGRRLSRGAAKRLFAADDDGRAAIARQLGKVESRRDSGILDELPKAYKNIDSVIAAQSDLVDVVQKLRTVLCVKG